MSTCPIKWENRTACVLDPGHVGVHQDRHGMTWWGQVLMEPIPGSLADEYRGQDPEPTVEPYSPAAVDETVAYLKRTVT